MKVICIKTIIQNTEIQKITTHFVNDYRPRLTIGREYLVMGMLIYKKSHYVYYLIDHEGWPTWVPYLFFNVIDNEIPQNWYIKLFNEHDHPYLNVLMGFNKLCNNAKFHDQLAEREEEAMLIYFERVEEMEQKLYKKGRSL